MPDKKTIYLFFGEDNFSSIQKVNHWKKEFEKKYGNINVETLNGKVQADELSGAYETAPFLAEKRLIVVENLLSKGTIDEQKEIAERLEDVSDTAILVFLEVEQPDQRTSLFKKIKKVGEITEFKFLAEAQLTAWVMNKAKEKGANVPSQIAAYMASLTGPNLWAITNELDKIHMYCKDRAVTKEDIDELVQPSLTSSIFKLTAYISQKDRKRSLKTLHILEDSGEELIRILFMIVRHFRILLQVNDLMSRGHGKAQILSKLREHPYTIQIAMDQCKNFDIGKLKEIYGELYKLDIGIKTGKIKSSGDEKKELMLAIEKFIVECCG
ncbi:MAG: DNA polymerase III subunit delta [Patescibacteria group bacterium]|nr:DNA polymerase III subunit delta [Patescibacteria group bacterium]